MSDCCPTPGDDIPFDFAAPTMARHFLERIGAISATRLPMPRTDVWSWKIHRVPKHAPLPHAEDQTPLLGSPEPDRGQTFSWPHPEFRELTDEEQRTEIL